MTSEGILPGPAVHLYAHTYYGLSYDAAHAVQEAMGRAGHWADVGTRYEHAAHTHDYWTLSTDAPDLIVAQLSPYGLPLPDQPDYQQRVGHTTEEVASGGARSS